MIAMAKKKCPECKEDVRGRADKYTVVITAVMWLTIN